MNQERYDICECGDYRHQHADDGGTCSICRPGDYYCGICLAFRLHMRAVMTWKVAAR